MRGLFNWKSVISKFNFFFRFFFPSPPYQDVETNQKYTWYYVPLMFSEMYVYVIYNIFKLCLIEIQILSIVFVSAYFFL